jgi:hypothetical protein
MEHPIVGLPRGLPRGLLFSIEAIAVAGRRTAAIEG